MADFATRWTVALSGTRGSVTARDLYRGRAFAITRAAAAERGARLGIVSAGLGYVRADTEVPPYSLSVASGADALRLLAPDFSPPAWWRSVKSGPFASDLAADVSASGVTLIVLTKPYAAMIGEELEGLSDRVESLRIFGLGLEPCLPLAVRAALMPYDERCEPTIGRGTRGDFGARALAYHLRHHTEADAGLEEAHRLARASAGPPPVRLTRATASDEQIAALIRKARATTPRSSSVRLVRDAGLACGSARFERIRAKLEVEA